MTDKEAILSKLNEHLRILQERKAKFSGYIPLELLNQIADYELAISLTEQVIAGEISEKEWTKAIEPLFERGNIQIFNIEATLSSGKNATEPGVLLRLLHRWFPDFSQRGGNITGGKKVRGSQGGDAFQDSGDNRSVAPVNLRLDAAVPEIVKVGEVFDLAVAIRQWSSSLLDEDDLTQVKSGDIQVTWPEDQTYIRLRINISAPDCIVSGEDTQSFQLFVKQDSPVFYFHLTPTKSGKISIIVKIYQEDDWLGSARVHTQASSSEAGRIQVEVTSQEIINPMTSIEQQIEGYHRRLNILKNIQAKKGIDTEPHYIIEIEDIEEKLEELFEMR